MNNIIESISNGQFTQARQQIAEMGFTNFASSLEGWLQLDLISQETFNKVAIIGLFAAGKIQDKNK